MRTYAGHGGTYFSKFRSSELLVSYSGRFVPREISCDMTPIYSELDDPTAYMDLVDNSEMSAPGGNRTSVIQRTATHLAESL
jgi:hypothetical protein